MIKINGLCPHCGSGLKIQCGQVDRLEAVYWYRSWNCAQCNFQLEEDGDETPEETREALLVNEGTWMIILDKGSKNATAYKLVKTVLKLTMQEVLKLKNDPIDMIYKGTKVEVEHFQRKLSDADLLSSIVPCTPFG